MLDFLRRLIGSPGQARAEVRAETWARVEAGLPFLAYLPDDDRPRLRALALDFLAHKTFHGANGLELDDDMMLTIALQAALPVLNIGLDAYRGWVGIVVYPGEILIPRVEMDEDGVVHEFDDSVLGEAWEDGPVLLSWHGDDEQADGVNIVIHEFAHKLDMANGGADGLPDLPATMSVSAWAEVFNEAYEHFCAAVDADEATLLDPYAAEHPAEFFAVASEVFFEDPCALVTAYPDVYTQLSRYYRQDPAGHAAACTVRARERPDAPQVDA